MNMPDFVARSTSPSVESLCWHFRLFLSFHIFFTLVNLFGLSRVVVLLGLAFLCLLCVEGLVCCQLCKAQLASVFYVILSTQVF